MTSSRAPVPKWRHQSTFDFPDEDRNLTSDSEDGKAHKRDDGPTKHIIRSPTTPKYADDITTWMNSNPSDREASTPSSKHFNASQAFRAYIMKIWKTSQKYIGLSPDVCDASFHDKIHDKKSHASHASGQCPLFRHQERHRVCHI